MIKKTLGRDYKTQEADVVKVKSALNKQGFYEIPSYGITPYLDTALLSAIKKFQKSIGLKTTGIIKPGDETDNALDDFQDDPGVRGPIIRCPECGGPHGGSKGDLCPDCDSKQ
jgi:peptidoglycan hydrolase-like protein with peptidoglycan-binding domain